jgi:hypothetical protein
VADRPSRRTPDRPPAPAAPGIGRDEADGQDSAETGKDLLSAIKGLIDSLKALPNGLLDAVRRDTVSALSRTANDAANPRFGYSKEIPAAARGANSDLEVFQRAQAMWKAMQTGPGAGTEPQSAAAMLSPVTTALQGVAAEIKSSVLGALQSAGTRAAAIPGAAATKGLEGIEIGASVVRAVRDSFAFVGQKTAAGVGAARNQVAGAASTVGDLRYAKMDWANGPGPSAMTATVKATIDSLQTTGALIAEGSKRFFANTTAGQVIASSLAPTSAFVQQLPANLMAQVQAAIYQSISSSAAGSGKSGQAGGAGAPGAQTGTAAAQASATANQYRAFFPAATASAGAGAVPPTVVTSAPSGGSGGSGGGSNPLANAAASVGTSIVSGLGGVATAAVAIPGVLVGMGAAIVGAAKGIFDFAARAREGAEQLNQTNRRWAAFNANIALQFAQFDINDLFRKMRFANATQESTGQLTRQVDQTRSSWEKWDQFVANASNNFQTIMSTISGVFGSIFSRIAQWIDPIRERIFQWLQNLSGDIANSLMGFADMLDANSAVVESVLKSVAEAANGIITVANAILEVVSFSAQAVVVVVGELYNGVTYLLREGLASVGLEGLVPEVPTRQIVNAIGANTPQIPQIDVDRVDFQKGVKEVTGLLRDIAQNMKVLADDVKPMGPGDLGANFLTDMARARAFNPFFGGRRRFGN